MAAILKRILRLKRQGLEIILKAEIKINEALFLIQPNVSLTHY